MKFISILARWFEPRASGAGDDDDVGRWRCDPLSHPVIEAMSQREIADLPLARRHRDAR